MKHIPPCACFAIFFLSFLSQDSFAGQDFYWRPQGTSRSFNTASNWRTANPATCNSAVASTVPGSTDTVIFCGCTCANTNLECHIDANISVAAIVMRSNYTDTVYQDNGKTFTFKKGTFQGGVFMGGNSAITCSHDATIDGNYFLSTSGDFTVKGAFTYKTGGFAHHSGRMIFNRVHTKLSLCCDLGLSASD